MEGEAETPSTAPNSTRGAMRGHGRGRSGAEPAKMRRVAQDSTPTAYMYTPSGSKDARIGHFSWYPPTTEGRSPRSGCPSRGASTVAPTVAARCQANQHRTAMDSQRALSRNTPLCGHAANPPRGERCSTRYSPNVQSSASEIMSTASSRSDSLRTSGGRNLTTCGPAVSARRPCA